MATVGEMVEEEWQEYVEQHDMILLAGATVPSLNALAILRDLGIWDAEVLEGKVSHGFDTDCAGFYPSDGSESRDLAGLIDPSYGGEVVRVIVLPAKEKEKRGETIRVFDQEFHFPPEEE